MQRAQWLAILLSSSEESEALLQLDVLLGGRGPDVYLSVCFFKLEQNKRLFSSSSGCCHWMKETTAYFCLFVVSETKSFVVDCGVSDLLLVRHVVTTVCLGCCFLHLDCSSV